MTARLTPEEKAQILRLAQSGATLSEIVRKSGRSRPTVSRYCKGVNAWRRCGAKVGLHTDVETLAAREASHV